VGPESEGGGEEIGSSKVGGDEGVVCLTTAEPWKRRVVGEMRSSRGNEGWRGCRVHFDTESRWRNEEIERRTVQGVDGGSCGGEG
jgi:hypothetical protein